MLYILHVVLSLFCNIRALSKRLKLSVLSAGSCRSSLSDDPDILNRVSNSECPTTIRAEIVSMVEPADVSYPDLTDVATNRRHKIMTCDAQTHAADSQSQQSKPV